MYDSIRHARTHRLVSFGLLANKIVAYRYGVPKNVIGELVDYRLSLTAMKEDDLLGVIANKYIEVLDLLVDYCRAFNNGEQAKANEFKTQAERKWSACDVLINQLIEE